MHAGYQKQYGRLLFGIEAEIDYLGLNEDSSVTARVPTSNNIYRLDQRVETDFFSSLRSRGGYVPEEFSGNLLLYATAGVTLTRARIDQTLTQINVAYSSQGLQENRRLDRRRRVGICLVGLLLVWWTSG